MIKYVGENGVGYTEENVKMIKVEEFIMDKVKKSKFETIEEAIDKGKAVTVWSESDGDGNTLYLEAHHAGFLISMEGDNHLEEEFKQNDQAYVATWLSFDMLKGIKEAMEQYGHLVEGNGN